jgi:hypothetical protein
MRAASRRAQMLVFARIVDTDIGEKYLHLWSELSGAAHHHAYELPPAPSELRSWHQRAAGVVADLRTVHPGSVAPAPRPGTPG